MDEDEEEEDEKDEDHVYSVRDKMINHTQQ